MNKKDNNTNNIKKFNNDLKSNIKSKYLNGNKYNYI